MENQLLAVFISMCPNPNGHITVANGKKKKKKKKEFSFSDFLEVKTCATFGSKPDFSQSQKKAKGSNSQTVTEGSQAPGCCDHYHLIEIKSGI